MTFCSLLAPKTGVHSDRWGRGAPVRRGLAASRAGKDRASAAYIGSACGRAGEGGMMVMMMMMMVMVMMVMVMVMMVMMSGHTCVPQRTQFRGSGRGRGKRKVAHL